MVPSEAEPHTGAGFAPGEPVQSSQVTVVVEMPVTAAENCCVPDKTPLAVDGVTVTPAVVLLLLHPVSPATSSSAAAANFTALIPSPLKIQPAWCCSGSDARRRLWCRPKNSH